MEWAGKKRNSWILHLILNSLIYENDTKYSKSHSFSSTQTYLKERYIPPFDTNYDYLIKIRLNLNFLVVFFLRKETKFLNNKCFYQNKQL